MQTVSATFTAASTATTRTPIGKIRMLWNDVYVDPTTVAASTDENLVSWPQQVYDGMETTPHKYTILDGTWELDEALPADEKYLAPGTQSEANVSQFGWYTGTISDGSGNFTPTVVLTVTFPTRVIDALKVVGEPTLGEYPVDFTLHVTNNAIEHLVATVTGNTLVIYDLDVSSSSYFDATEIKLSITKWSAINTMAKIIEFFTVVIDDFTGADIVSMEILEEREIKNGSLPVGNISCNELNLTLQNIRRAKYGTTYDDPFSYGNTTSPWHNLIVNNRRVTAYLGFRTIAGDEYVNAGTFWTNDWTNKDESFSVTVSCRDRMELLRKATYKGEEILENKTVGYLINYLLEKARDLIPLADLTWTFLPTEAEGNTLFDYTVPICWFGKDNYMGLLRHLVEVGLGQAYMSKDDVLIIEDWNGNDGAETPDITLTTSSYFSKDLPENTDDLSNIIKVNVHTLTAAGEETTVYDSGEGGERSIAASSSETISIEFTSIPVSDPTIIIYEESTGVTMSVVSTYAYGADLLIENSEGTIGSYKIKATGTEYSYNVVTPIELRDETSIFMYGEKTYEYPNNHFVQTETVGNAIAAKLLATYKTLRKDLTIEWRGNPAVELGDTVQAPIYYKNPTSVASYVIVKNNIKFDGGLEYSTNARAVVEDTTTTTTTAAPTTTTTTAGA